MVLAQSGTDVTATITPEGSGLACTYKGTAGPGTMTLNATNCDAPLIVVRCSVGDLSVNQATLIGTSITASVSKGVADGTVAQTFNVMDAGGDPAAGLTTTSALTAVRR
jgi:hypothetical protein